MMFPKGGRKMVSKAQLQAKDRYEKRNYWKTLIRFKKEDEDLVRQYANGNLNGFVVSAVMEKIEKMKKDQG